MRFIWVNDQGDEEHEDLELPGYKSGASNQMELQACIVALREAARHPKLAGYEKILIFTDSTYVASNFKNAMFRWPKQKWMTHDGAPVENAKQWKDFVRELKALDPIKIDIKWVKGHKDNPHNKAAHKLAKLSAKIPLNPPLRPVKVRRKKSAKSTKRGSVEMAGQRLRIRIVSGEYLEVQHFNKFRYEVLSKKSKYFEKVDVIYSEEQLSEGHDYEIVVNRDTQNPRIVRVLRELS